MRYKKRTEMQQIGIGVGNLERDLTQKFRETIKEHM